MRRFRAAILLCGALAVAIGCEERVLGPADEVPGASLAVIDRPALTAGEPQYGRVVTFGWRGAGGGDPAFVRHLSGAVVDTNGAYNPSFDIVRDLNDHPERYESRWTPWVAWDAPGDSGRSTVVGDDETLAAGRFYVFAVQARDARGVAGDAFTTATNVRRFRVKSSTAPLLRIYEERLVGFRFLGTALRPEARELPPGVPLRFRWVADAGDYAGEIVGYRWAWDLADPAAWDAPYEAGSTSAPEVAFGAGSHTLFVEAIDRAGDRTLGRVTVVVVPFPMDRDLLLVDDYIGPALQPEDWSVPSEAQDDALWARLCAKAPGFDPSRDVYDCAANGLRPPGPDVLGRYKNVVWNFSSSDNAWGRMVIFTPESRVGTTSRHPINYVSLFLLKGGHSWTLGSSERGGGLAATLAPAAQVFPMSVECEVAGTKSSCDGDRGGAADMAYRDFCVSVLDKVNGVFRSDPAMPTRSADRFDALVSLELDGNAPAAPAEWPVRVGLRDEVTMPGRRFDPADTLGPGGLTSVEIYDPEYWMAARSIVPRLCFEPLYRMRSADPASAVDGSAVAIRVTAYENVTPEVAAGIPVAAPSVHFGFPLWYFRPGAADSIADAVFRRWGIGGTP